MTIKVKGLKIVGLTGGIGSGKSTVAEMFRGYGIPVVDADKISRSLLDERSSTQDEILRLFPEARTTGVIDRRALAKIVFSDPERRSQLEGLMHPIIAAEVCRQACEHMKAGHTTVVYDAPLLMESGHDKEIDEVVLVFVPEQVQVARALARGGLTEDQIRARIAVQMPWDEKFKRSTFVIDNSGPREETANRVRWFVASLGLPSLPRAG